MQRKRSPLFKKYFTVTLAVVLASLAVLGSALMLFISNYWRNEKSSLLSENTLSISRSVSDLMNSGRWTLDRENSTILICNTLSMISSSIDADVFISDVNGKVIFCKELLSPQMYLKDDGSCIIHNNFLIPKDIMSHALGGSYASLGKLDTEIDTMYLIVGDPIVVENQVIGIVFATTPIASGLTPYIMDILRMFLFSAILALILAFCGVYILTYKLIKPLQQMSAATKCYAVGDFSYRVEAEGDDELSDLVRGFNSMARDLSILESSRRSFVANVSHELKTPMTTIGGFIDGILDGTIPPEKQSYYLRIVSDEVKRLSRLVVSMLNMSKIEAGELELKPKTYDISTQIFQTLLSFEQSIESKNIQLVGLDKLQSVFIEADEDLIHQVIYNLIDNAVKFTQDGGTISLSVFSDQEKAVVRIYNTGEGIPQDDISRVFERFYKADKSRSMDVKGTGLGLYIVKNIIEMHSGQISVKSQEGAYTEFVFWLPLKYGDI